MRITIDTDESFAPGCFILCQVDDQDKWDTRNESRTKLVQRDTDLPGLARSFGWTGTDDQTDDACEWLYSYAPGTIIDDPGYFD